MALYFSINSEKENSNSNSILYLKIKNREKDFIDTFDFNDEFMQENLGVLDINPNILNCSYFIKDCIIWTWSNIGSYYRDNECLFDLLLKMIEAYNPDERFKTNFANKMIDVMEEKLRKTDLKNKDYEKVFQWVKRSQCWVELYRNKITEFIG